jgi:hypothetical protein
MNRLSRELELMHLPKKLGLIILLFVCTYALFTGAIYMATQGNTPGTDFYIYYAASRNIVQKGISPYNENVGEESQMAVLKRAAEGGEDQLRFVYPPYALIPALPLVHLPFQLAQAAWMSFGLLLLFSTFAFAFPKSPPWLVASLLMLYPIFFGFLLGNFDILIISGIFLLFGRLPRVRLENNTGQIFLGICLAWITVKPQFTWFYCLFFLIVALRRKLKVLLLSFVGGVIAFLAISFLLVPNWISEWIHRVLIYPSYTGGKISITPLLIPILSPQYFPIIYGICFLILTGTLIVLFRKWHKEEFSTLALLAFGGFFTFFFHPHGNAYEQLTFLIPFILWVVQIAQKNPVKGAIAWIILVCISWIIFFTGRFDIIPESATNGLYVLYSIWLLFGLVLPPRFLR